MSSSKPKFDYKLFTIILLSLIIFMFLIFPIFLILSTSGSQTGNVAIIYINGLILTETSSGLFSVSGTSSTNIVRQIESAENNNKIKAIVFEINSPGGSGVASDEIAQAIKGTTKPTVAYIRETGASGAYWVASASDKIYSNRLSVVGSIGVIASYLEFSGLLDDYNITYQRFVAGEHKDLGSPFRKVTEIEEIQFQEFLDELHTIFILEIANNRNLDEDYVRNIADGSIFSGNRAKELMLIDEIGGRKEALNYVEELIGEKVMVVDMRPTRSITNILRSFSNNGLQNIGYGIGESFKNTESKHMFALN